MCWLPAPAVCSPPWTRSPMLAWCSSHTPGLDQLESLGRYGRPCRSRKRSTSRAGTCPRRTSRPPTRTGSTGCTTGGGKSMPGSTLTCDDCVPCQEPDMPEHRGLRELQSQLGSWSSSTAASTALATRTVRSTRMRRTLASTFDSRVTCRHPAMRYVTFLVRSYVYLAW